MNELIKEYYEWNKVKEELKHSKHKEAYKDVCDVLKQIEIKVMYHTLCGLMKIKLNKRIRGVN